MVFFQTGSGFTGMDKRAFDSLGSRGFTGLDKRAPFDSFVSVKFNFNWSSPKGVTHFWYILSLLFVQNLKSNVLLQQNFK